MTFLIGTAVIAAAFLLAGLLDKAVGKSIVGDSEDPCSEWTPR